jgi:hypothetical protein
MLQLFCTYSLCHMSCYFAREICFVLYISGAGGGAVVEALRYKPEGRGIDF